MEKDLRSLYDSKDTDLLTIIESNYGRANIKGNGAWVRSPFNEKDKNPSMVIMLTDSDRFTEGFYKDFSTGRSGNIYSLLNIPHDWGFKEKRTKLPTLNSPQVIKTHMSTLDYSPSDYLFGRGIPYEVQQEFKIFEIDGHVSMPVFDRDGYLIYNISRDIGVKGYNVSATTDAYPALTHTVKTSDTVFVCESMIDAYTLVTVGLKAISLNGAGNHAGLRDIFRFHFGRIVLALDPDEVGQKNASIIKDMLSDKDVVNIVLPRDVNDTWTGILAGTPTRQTARTVFLKVIERKVNNKMMPCMDCGKETINSKDYYMVKDDVWLAAVPEENGCGVFFLCQNCLSGRLGRPLKDEDFIDCGLNEHYGNVGQKN